MWQFHKRVAGKASAGEDDPYLRILQAAHIEDDEYFSHMIQTTIAEEFYGKLITT